MNLLPVPRALELAGETVPSRPPAHRVDASLPAQGYELRIDRNGVDLTAADDAGRFYGEATLAQLVRLGDGTLPAGTRLNIGTIADEFDVSRDTVQSAIGLLADDGLVERFPGLGWYVRDSG